jgi:hypothetical protein
MMFLTEELHWRHRGSAQGRGYVTGHVLQTLVTYASVASVAVSFKLMHVCHPTESSLGGHRQPAIHRAAATVRVAYISGSKGLLATWTEKRKLYDIQAEGTR